MQNVVSQERYLKTLDLNSAKSSIKHLSGGRASLLPQSNLRCTRCTRLLVGFYQWDSAGCSSFCMPITLLAIMYVATVDFGILAYWTQCKDVIDVVQSLHYFATNWLMSKLMHFWMTTFRTRGDIPNRLAATTCTRTCTVRADCKQRCKTSGGLTRGTESEKSVAVRDIGH